MSYLEAQTGGAFLPARVAHFQTNLFLPQLTAAAIATITTATNDAPPKTRVFIVPVPRQNSERLRNEWHTPLARRLVCAEGRYLEGNAESGTEKRAATFVGPECGTVTRPDLVEVAREAGVVMASTRYVGTSQSARFEIEDGVAHRPGRRRRNRQCY